LVHERLGRFALVRIKRKGSRPLPVKSSSAAAIRFHQPEFSGGGVAKKNQGFVAPVELLSQSPFAVPACARAALQVDAITVGELLLHAMHRVGAERGATNHA
jgi:hypothetical protein